MASADQRRHARSAADQQRPAALRIRDRIAVPQAGQQVELDARLQFDINQAVPSPTTL
ncbi:MAG: hypothetical protein ACLVJK_01265 [Alistipes putredinis]